MRQNQKGAVDFILILVFIAVVIVGVLIYLRVIDKEEAAKITNFDECVAAGNPVAESYPAQCTTEDGQSFTQDISQDNNPTPQSAIKIATTANGLVTEYERIFMSLPGDENKLPPETPESFKVYMRELLNNNPTNSFGCNNIYDVSKISALNIYGGTHNSDPNSVNSPNSKCGGGAGSYWYLKNNKWSVISTQVGFSCEELSNTTVYSEFVKTCFLGDGSYPRQDRPNPNGSIVEALAN